MHATEDELIRHCASRLADFKVPRRIEFRKQLAKTYNDKVRRFGPASPCTRTFADDLGLME
jgi:acyl-coenzyme A synthetase/AMP-(fatty) acid ligase